nr:hypothetical protein [Tanacetum cinerariifolium]
MSKQVRRVRALDIQVTLHDKRIVMQVTLHYEAIVMQVTLHDKRIVMQVTLHYEAIVMQVTLHDKRIVMQVTLHYEFKQKFLLGITIFHWSSSHITIVIMQALRLHHMKLCTEESVDRLYAGVSYPKTYTDKRGKPLEFEVGDMIQLKVSPWNGDVRFGKRKKLSPHYTGSFKILARVTPVAYTFEFPEELKGIHSTFHVSNLHMLAEGDVIIPVDEIKLDDKLHMIEEPVEVVNREEREDQIKKNYPHLFTSKDEAKKADKSS